MSVIDEIKARVDIVDLVSETVQLRRSGKNYTGFCPFHPNTRTPSFAVFPDSGTWRCFGQCNEGGDIFKYVMKKEGWDFPEALHYLAERAGVQLTPPTQQQQEAAEEHDHLRALLEEAATFYHHQLMNTPGGKIALDYLLQKRGLQAETLESFALGYAPHSWDAILQYLRSRSHSEQELLDAGLVGQRDEGGVYDRFRHRIMFPIRDERGRMAGFGARILNPDDVPKFLNSPQTAVFDKGRLLYGLDHARRAIRSLDQVVIVEGYLDVIALHQAGYANAVSPMGTALTEHQLNLLKRFSKRIVLALDPDAAGNAATLRGLQIARQTMEREQDPVFDARGLLGYEARLQADIRVTVLPEGLDPDEVVNRDPKEWERIVAEARPVVIHVMETLASGRDLDDPKIKSEIASQVLPLIEDIPNPVERDTYRQRLARLLRVDERALLGSAPGGARSRPKPRGEQRRQPSGSSTAAPEAESHSRTVSSSYLLEAHCLGVLLRRPGLLYQVDRLLLQEGLPRLIPNDFQHADHQSILRLFQDSIDQDMTEPLDFVFNNLSLPMMDIADSMLERTEKFDPSDDRVLDDLMRGLLDLRKRNLHQEIDYQRYLLQEAQEGADRQQNSLLETSQYLETMVQLTEMKRRLDQAISQYTGHSTVTRAAKSAA
ncbi:MAG: DNA primase [Anaerolineales bacterium]|nr:DNA primase [Anaerolineales bacterium]